MSWKNAENVRYPDGYRFIVRNFEMLDVGGISDDYRRSVLNWTFYFYLDLVFLILC